MLAAIVSLFVKFLGAHGPCKWMEKECWVAFQVVYQKFSKINTH
jgi:hypothetical protein